jgi:hypothetical protein
VFPIHSFSQNISTISKKHYESETTYLGSFDKENKKRLYEL